MQRKWFIGTLVILGLVPALLHLWGNASGGENAPPSGETQNQVNIDNFTFSPAKLSVHVGTKVTWVNRDDVPHTVTSKAKPRTLDSGTLDTDGRYSHVFDKPGTYDYFCAVHQHMTGQILVK